MINPLEFADIPDVPRGRGLGYQQGDYAPAMRPLPGGLEPGTGLMPGDVRLAGSKIKGLAQYDPTIFAKLFP